MKMPRFMRRIGTKAKIKAPEIWFAVGVAGLVGTVVTACRATTKLEQIKAEEEEKCQEIIDATEEGYTEEDKKNDLSIIKRRYIVKKVTNYILPAALGALTLFAFGRSYKVLKTRNVALASSLATALKELQEERARIAEKYGENALKEIQYDIHEEATEDGEIVSKIGDAKAGNELTRIMDASNPLWDPSPEILRMRLMAIQKDLNREMRLRYDERTGKMGYMLLNEILEKLYFKPTQAGCILCKTYDPKNPIGDNFLDFGIYDSRSETNRRFINGDESIVFLNFNMDGDITNFNVNMPMF